MLFHNKECSFYFIDPTLRVEQSGDGSSPTNAAKNFPSNITDDKIFVLRRTPDTIKYDNQTVRVYATLPNMNKVISQLTIIGMPREGESFYEEISTQFASDSALATWKADTHEYGVFLVNQTEYNSNSPVKIQNCKFFRMTGCMMYTLRSSYDYDPWFIEFTKSRPNIFIKRCSFRPLNATYRPDETGKLKIQDLGGYGYGYYINAESETDQQYANYNCRGQSLVLEDLVMDYGGDETYHALTFGQYDNIRIKNIEIYSRQSRRNAYAIRIYGRPGGNTYTEMDGVTLNFIRSGRQDRYVPGAVYITYMANASIKNLTYRRIQNVTGEPTGWYSNCLMASTCFRTHFDAQGSGKIENVSINIPELRGTFGSLLYIDHDYGSDYRNWKAPMGQYVIVDGITIITGDATDTQDFYGDGTVVREDGNFDNWDIFSNEYGDHGKDGMLRLFARASTDYERHPNPCDIFLVRNLTLNCYLGVAAFFHRCLLDLGTAQIRGHVAIDRCVGKIGSVKVWRPGYAVNMGNGSLVTINSIVCNRRNTRYTYNAYAAVRPDQMGRCANTLLVDSTNVKFFPEDYYSTEPRNDNAYTMLMVCRSEITDSAYVVRNREMKGQTWSVSRVGSNLKCSLKLTNEQRDDEVFPLVVGSPPFQGIKIKDLPTGKIFLRTYVTTFGYNFPEEMLTGRKLWMMVILPDGSRHFSEEGNWSEDTETQWNEIDANTSFKMDLPIDNAQAGDAYVVYYFNWYTKEAATYLDPYPAVFNAVTGIKIKETAPTQAP